MYMILKYLFNNIVINVNLTEQNYTKSLIRCSPNDGPKTDLSVVYFHKLSRFYKHLYKSLKNKSHSPVTILIIIAFS